MGDAWGDRRRALERALTVVCGASFAALKEERISNVSIKMTKRPSRPGEKRTFLWLRRW
jgi:hypothetical protein